MSELEVFKQADWVDPENRFVFWSGGKDSTVALHLALRAWKNPHVVFVDTGITIPETLEYVEKLTEEWNLSLTLLKPEIDFWSYCLRAGFPRVNALWCRRLLKMEPTKKFLKAHPGWKVVVLGIRATESFKRKTSPFYQKHLHRHTKLPFTYELLPILNWTDKQVDDYMMRVQIPPNPAYKEYATSGCYYCPFVNNPKHYLALKRNYPELFQNIVDAEKAMRKGGTAIRRKSIIPVAEQQFLKLEG